MTRLSLLAAGRGWEDGVTSTVRSSLPMIQSANTSSSSRTHTIVRSPRPLPGVGA